MAQKLDGLIEWVLEEIVFSGQDGVSVAKVLSFVDAYYDAANQKTINEKGKEVIAVAEEVPLIDHDFKARVWKCLTDHPDALVGESRAGNHLTLEQIEALPVASPTDSGLSGEQASSSPFKDVVDLAEKDAEAFQESQESPSSPSSSWTQLQKRLQQEKRLQQGAAPGSIRQQPRIYASEEHTWKLLTGHGMKSNKVTGIEWQLLYVIAMAGPDGFVQANLARAAGQDKHAIGRRTDKLVTLGLIEKRQIVIFGKPQTYLLKHKKFIVNQANFDFSDLAASSDLQASARLLDEEEPVPCHELWNGEIIDTEVFARAIVSVVRAWGTIQFSILRRKMNADSIPWKRIALRTTVRELRALGILKKVDGELENDFTNVRKVYIKFIRPPTPEEWFTFQRKPGEFTRNQKTKPAKSNGRKRKDSDAAQDQEEGSDNGSMSDASERPTVSGDAEANPTLINDDDLGRLPHSAGSPVDEDASIANETMAQTDRVDGQPENVRYSTATATHPSYLTSVKPPPRRRGRPPKNKTLVTASTPASATPQEQPGESSRLPEISHVESPRKGRRPRMLSSKLRQTTDIPLNIATSEIVEEGQVSSPHGTQDASNLERNLELRKIYGKRKPANKAKFASYDDVQREAGFPGVYFDIQDLKPLGQGRPKTQKIALFKSEKFKTLPWMREVAVQRSLTNATPATLLNLTAPAVVVGTKDTNNDGQLALKRKRDGELEPGQDEPQKKRALLNAARDFGRQPLGTYLSPYQSQYQSPFKSPSYVSPYETNSLSAPSSTAQTNHLNGSSLTQSIQSAYVSPFSTVSQTLATPPSSQVLSVAPSADLPAEVAVTTRSPVKVPSPLNAQSLLDAAFEAAIEAAGSTKVPDVAFQLPSIKDGIAGNLCLSASKNVLIFKPADEEIESPVPSLHISAIIGSPQVSPHGPKPGELRITIKDENDKEVMHRFRFANTEAGFKAANNMRAKIATIITLLDLERFNDASQSEVVAAPDAEKPFKCDQCGGAWKNWEGIKYHQTKSKTMCNPNYRSPVKRKGEQAEESPTKPRRGRTATNDAIDGAATPPGTALVHGIEYRGTQASPVPSQLLVVVAHDAGSDELLLTKLLAKPQVDNQSSVVHNADNESTGKPLEVRAIPLVGSQPPAANSSPMPTISNPPTAISPPVVPEDSPEAAGSDRLPASSNSPSTLPQPAIQSRLPKTAKSDINVQRRKEVIMTLLEANGQAFPAEQSLWFCLVAALLRKYPDSGLQNYTDCDAAVELLVDSGHIRKVQFSFRDKVGMIATRTIITVVGMDPLSGTVVELKEKMKAAYPEHYVPPEFAPPKVVQSMLEEREKRQVLESASLVSSSTGRQPIKSMPPPATPGLNRQTSSVERAVGESIGSASKDIRTTRSGRVSRTPRRPDYVENSLLLYQEQPDVDLPDHNHMDNDSENSYDEEFEDHEEPSRRDFSMSVNRYSISNPSTNYGPKKQNHSRTPGRRSGGVRKVSRPKHSSDAGIMKQPLSDDELGLDTDSDAPQRIRKSRAKSGSISVAVPRRKTIIKSYVGPEMWQSPIAYLQDDTGAWAIQISLLPKRIYHYKPRLPEPITYMQTLTSPAWDFRPYGHGVRPVHARPSKRAEESNFYLDRLENGFRPVVMPKTRKYGPAAPSKQMLARFSASPDDNSPAPEKTKKRGRPPRSVSQQRGPSIEPTPKRKRGRPFAPEQNPISKLVESRGPLDVGSPMHGQGVSGFSYARTQSPYVNRALRPGSSSMLPYETMVSMDSGSGFLPYSLGDQNAGPSFSTMMESSTFNNSPTGVLTHTATERQMSTEMSELNDFLPVMDEYNQDSGSEYQEDDTQDNTRLRHRRKTRNETPQSLWEEDSQAPGGPLMRQYMMTTRRLTALPADIEGIFTPNPNDPDLNIEVAYEHQHNQRKRTKDGSISNDLEKRLMVAVVVVRTLTGGLDKVIDWVMVSKLFPEYPMHYVQKKWSAIIQKHKTTISRLDTDFQDWFITAYEKGQVPVIDYDHLLEYDWDSLIDTVTEQLDIRFSKPSVRLPASRARLDQAFIIKKAEDDRPWRDEFFGLQQPVYKRLQNAASEPQSLPIVTEPEPNPNIDDLTIAKSWARANTVTPSGVYDPNFAAQKLSLLGTGTIKAATNALLSSKVLMQRNKGRATPGRGVEITDTFAASLRTHLDEKQLSQACAFKTSLDARFAAGETVWVDWAASDGDVLAMTNLQAHGRIRIEPVGMPMNKFGLTDGDYQTKRMDKSRLRFDMQLLPTETYLYDPDLPVLEKFIVENLSVDEPQLNKPDSSYSAAPPRGTQQAIPLWFDIAENLMEAMWKKVVCAVLATIAMRPGAPVKELVRVFTPALEEWEMRLLLEWGVRVGALVEVMEGHEGWNVGEWWWVIGGRAGEGGL